MYWNSVHCILNTNVPFLVRYWKLYIDTKYKTTIVCFMGEMKTISWNQGKALNPKYFLLAPRRNYWQISAKIYTETLVVCNIPQILTKFVLKVLGSGLAQIFICNKTLGPQRKIMFWSFCVSIGKIHVAVATSCLCSSTM